VRRSMTPLLAACRVLQGAVFDAATPIVMLHAGKDD
jgi:hypothetical protein